MRNGRLAKAEQFASAAELIDELADGDHDLHDALRMTATDRRRASRAAEALLTAARLSSTA